MVTIVEYNLEHEESKEDLLASGEPAELDGVCLWRVCMCICRCSVGVAGIRTLCG